MDCYILALAYRSPSTNILQPVITLSPLYSDGRRLKMATWFHSARRGNLTDAEAEQIAMLIAAHASTAPTHDCLLLDDSKH